MRGPVTTLVEDLGYPTAIALDDDHVYVADATAGSIVRAAKRGGEPVVLARDLDRPLDLVAGAEHLFVTLCVEDGAVLRIPKGGGEPTVIARSQVFPGALALDEERVYWTTLGDDRDNGTVRASPRIGGPATTIACRQIGPNGIGVDASYVYWLDGYDYVLAIDKAGAAPPVILHRPHEAVEERLAEGEPLPPMFWDALLVLDPSPPPLRRIAVRDEYAYWQSASGSIARVATWEGNQPASTPLLLAVDRYRPSAVDLDEDWVYWTDCRGGRIRRVRLGCGRPRAVAVKQRRPLAIAVDQSAVYWTVGGAPPDFQGGAVRMRKKGDDGQARSSGKHG
jgi:hypothetical protein